MTLSIEEPPALVRSVRDRRRRAETVWAGLLLAILLAALHQDVVFLGRSLVLSNLRNPLDGRPLAQNYGEGFIAPDEWSTRNLSPFPNIRDPGATWWQWEPGIHFLRRAIERREWPLWDPYSGAGTPAMANLVPAFFFPPSLLVTLLGGSAQLLNLYFLAMLWFAAFVSFLFLRASGLALSSSLIGATTVLMGGALNQNVGSFLGQTGACLPVVMYATRRWLDRPSGRRTAMLAAVYAAVALASFPPILLGLFGIAGLYAIVGIVAENAGTRMRTTALWSAAILVGMGLVAFYYLPAIALMRASPQAAAGYHGAGLEAMPLENVFHLLSPTVRGGVQYYLTGPFAHPVGVPHIPYFGAAALMLAMLAGGFGGGKSRTLFVGSLLAVVLILLKIFGLPPAQWIGHLPLFDRIHYAVYFGIPLGYPLAFLAALGFERIVRNKLRMVHATVAAVVVLVAVESLWWQASSLAEFQLATATDWVRDWKVLGGAAVAAGLVIVLSSQGVATVRASAAAAFLLVITVEGVYNNFLPNPRVWDVFAQPAPYVRALQDAKHSGRVLSFQFPCANCNGAFEIHTLDSLMPFNPPRAMASYVTHADGERSIFMRAAKRLPSEVWLDRANVALISVPAPFVEVVRDAVGRGYRKRFDDGLILLFERATLPRFFFTSDYRLSTPEVALAAPPSSGVRQILVEHDPALPQAPNSPTDPDVQVLEYHRNSLVLEVRAPRPGLVYASESFFDGWFATVNGREAEILPANYAFRAVAVPAGSARVELYYWPPGLTAGITVTVIAVVSAVALVALSGTRPRRTGIA